MKTLKRIGNWFVHLFGFNKNSKYVSSYLNTANMRSGIYMAAIIVVLEIWMIIRQNVDTGANKIRDLVSKGAPYVKTAFQQTSGFWLFLALGLAMLLYCLFYNDEKKNIKKSTSIIIISTIGLILVSMIGFESQIEKWNPSKVVNNVLLISLYASIGLFHVAVIIATIHRYRGGNNQWISSVLVISAFALACLIFGVRVSYSDFFTASQIEAKQFICFLMMTIYVGCLLIWKPYISIGVLGSVFLGFFLLIKNNVGEYKVYNIGELIEFYDSSNNVIPIDTSGVARILIRRDFLEGDQVNYLTFFISLAMVCVSIYIQRVAEARKDEELEILATKDTLTGLLAFEYFTNLVSKKAQEKEVNIGEWIYIFLDITSFKIFNDQRGFTAGNQFLKDVGGILKEQFPDGLVTRQSDDHYVVFCKNENIEEKVFNVECSVEKLDLDIRPGVKAGGYILKDKQEDPHRSVEKARYACAELKKRHGGSEYLEYDQKMHDNYRLIQYVVRHVDEAIANGYIKAYYQPVVWSENKELCGCEALARWIDPRYGFMNPGIFVGALEDAQLVHKLDVAMLRIVCQDLKKNLDAGLPAVPVSINFSRLDFMVMDVPNVIESIVNEYGLAKDMIHVEVTESALLEQGNILKESMKELKKKGFALWLDDFGSGYSSFNAIKDYDFDVLKLDMQFLVGFNENEKSKAVINSVISMAEQVGMKTLSEGVETEEQAKFLREISCGKLQGYLFGKPVPYEDIMKRMLDGEFAISKKFE